MWENVYEFLLCLFCSYTKECFPQVTANMMAPQWKCQISLQMLKETNKWNTKQALQASWINAMDIDNWSIYWFIRSIQPWTHTIHWFESSNPTDPFYLMIHPTHLNRINRSIRSTQSIQSWWFYVLTGIFLSWPTLTIMRRLKDWAFIAKLSLQLLSAE